MKIGNPPSPPFRKAGERLLLPLKKGGGEGFKKVVSND
jgi:hypothetical protein